MTKSTKWMRFKNLFGFASFYEWLTILKEDFEREIKKDKTTEDFDLSEELSK